MVEGKVIDGASQFEVFPDGRVMRGGKPARIYPHPRYGTLRVSVLMDRGYWTVHVVSRLVGRAFCPDFREDLRPVHINGDRNDCRASNLRWVPISAVTPGGGKRKLSDSAVADIVSSADPPRVLSERHGISKVHVWYLRRKHLTKPRRSCPLVVR